jgi:hypothetical protein
MNRNPTQLWKSPRCGAKTRAGHPCRSPAVRDKKRCRMHGAFAGAPRGERHGNYKDGRRSIEVREARAGVRERVRSVEVATADLMDAAGLKPLKSIRRHRHVRAALVEAAAAKQEKAE